MHANDNVGKPRTAEFYFWLIMAFLVSVVGTLALLVGVFGR